MSTFPTYPYKDPHHFTDLNALLVEIENILLFLENQSHLLSGSILASKPALAWYDKQVVFLKQYYEAAERLIYHG